MEGFGRQERRPLSSSNISQGNYCGFWLATCYIEVTTNMPKHSVIHASWRPSKLKPLGQSHWKHSNRREQSWKAGCSTTLKRRFECHSIDSFLFLLLCTITCTKSNTISTMSYYPVMACYKKNGEDTDTTGHYVVTMASLQCGTDHLEDVWNIVSHPTFLWLYTPYVGSVAQHIKDLNPWCPGALRVNFHYFTCHLVSVKTPFC